MDRKSNFYNNSLNNGSYFLAGAKFGDILKIVINPPTKKINMMDI
jgi:hypothetical protein